ncbi:hypothetical protein [Rhodanobacter sp. OR92]|uniref:hypothetical protein n=1 Tax=Rhodanobacter sp. OR92 TaxID=1076524 RepID=UPI000418BA2F|nr:hypothetical protein [Rhodanobacter sp. OR92]
MADPIATASRSWLLILALQAQLSTITVANGYLTDAGSNVWTTDHQRTDALGLMIYSEPILGPGLDNERPGKPVRIFSLLVEGSLSTSLDDAQQQIHALIEDVENCIAAYGQGKVKLPPGAGSVHVADIAILDRPEGAAEVAMQARIIVRYFR